MAKRLQLRRGTTTENNAFKGALGELTYDTELDRLRIHNGSTVGGKVIVGTRLVTTTPINADTENTTGVLIISVLGNTNLPFDLWGVLSVYSNENFTSALRVYQTFQPDTSSDLYIRRWYNGSWTAWERSVKISEKNTEAYAVGQTYTDVTSSRFVGTSYLNSSAKPRTLYVTSTSFGYDPVAISVNGLLVNSAQASSSYAGAVSICAVVLPGQTYAVSGSVSRWVELN